jgi:carbon-monoxide dehydrogenase large subunit
MTTTTERSAPPRGYLGASVRRREDVRFLTGTATYLDDVEVPNALHVAFVRSPHAHARLGSVETAAALAAPGVVAVFSARDLPGRRLPPPRAFPHTTIVHALHPVYAGNAVRYVGQVVAMVVAVTRAAAEDAAELVAVDYEPLDAVVDVREAMRSAVQLHADAPENVVLRYARRSGDVEGAFAAAAHVVRRTVRIPRLAIVPMETRGALAAYDPGTDLLTVWSSAQDPHRHRAAIARVLDRPEDRIHLIVPDVGGGFGQKSYPQAEVIAVAHAATALRRPVKWAEDRRENFQAAHHGRGIEADAELAVAADGKFLAVRAQLLADCGAYVYSSVPNAGITAASLLSGCYEIGAADVTLLGVVTNRVPTSPYRGAGRPEAAIILEALVDEAARALRRDPIELRRANVITRFPYATATGVTYDSGNYRALLDTLVDVAELQRLREEQALARLEGRLVGIGAALYVERSGGGWEAAAASIEPGGRVVARIGSSPHGQGHETSFAQVIATTLDVPIEAVVVRWGDSSEVPRGTGTFASRSMTMGGGALHRAAERLRAKALELAAHVFGVPVDELVWERGRVAVRSAPDRALDLAELAAAAYDPQRVPPDFDLGGLSSYATFSAEYGYSTGAHLAVIEIDRALGAPRLLRFVAVDDAGTIVNPLLAEGQIVGGIAQGIGEALFEEVGHDEFGQPQVASFLDYPLVTAVEMPPVTTAFLSSPSPLHPLGIKGVAEGGACGAPAAIANAVADALAPLGAPALDMPFTGEKLWRALQR